MPRDGSRRRGESRPDLFTDDRAVSEVLSYALIFSMIVVSIGIVTVGGLGSLQDARSNEHLSNAERAFDVLHDNLGDVHEEEAPSRATEISLGDAQLYLADTVTMTVGTGTGQVQREIRPIVFRVQDERRMVYAAGATLRTQRDGGIVVSEPPFLVTRDEAFLPVVQTTSPDVTGVGGGTALIRGQSANRSVPVAATGGSVTLDYIRLDTPRADVWGRYFEQQDYCGGVSVSGSVVTCTVDGNYDDPERLFVTVQRIDVTLVE